MDFDLLKTFVLLAHYKSFTKTAEIQNIVQSTVTARINELERQLGKELFVRSNRKVDISKEGSVFLPFAQRILSVYDESISKLNAVNTFENYLAIGANDSMWHFGVSKLIKVFLVRSPNLAVKTMIRHSYEIIQLLIDNAIDVGFITRPPRMNKFEIVPCFHDDIILTATPEIAASIDRTGITLPAMFQLPLLYPILDDNFEEWTSQNIPLGHSFRFQVDIYSMLLPFLIEGYGPGLILRSLVQKELDSGALMEIPIVGKSSLPKWTGYLIYAKEKKNLPAIQELLSTMEREVQDGHLRG